MNKCVIDIKIPDYITVCTDGGEREAAISGDCVQFDDVCVEFAKDGEHCAIFLTAQTSPVRWLKLRWNNMKWEKKAKFLGDAWERGYSDLQWQGMSARRFMPWYFAATYENTTICYGVKVRPSALCFWQVDSAGMTLFMDVRCGGNGVKLDGRRLQTAEVLGSKLTDCTSFAALSDFCGDMCTDPILPSYPVYGSNNWYYAYGDSSEEEILSDTDYIVRLTRGAENRPYMVIDDCWQEHHRLNEYNGGPWTKGNAKFPDMKGLAQKLTAKGVRPGIWVRLLQNEAADIPQEWRLSINGCLDPSHPDALAYIKNDVKRICGWGYTLIKHDFSTFDLFGRWGFEMNPLVTQDGWHFYNEGMTSAEVVKLLYKAILEACNDDTIILGCNAIGHLGAGLMHMNRTGDDTSGLNWERTRSMGVNTLAFRLPQHRKFYEVDADCVGIDYGISWQYNKQWADLLAQSGTSLFVSARPGLLSDSENEELHQIMLTASEQKNHVIPTDWEYTDCPEEWEDTASGIKRKYDWYEKSGVKFKTQAVRYTPYLSIIG